MCAMPGSSSGSSPGPVGVEGPADRVGQPVLVVQGAAVDLAGELREAVGRARRRAVAQVLLGGRELGGPLEHHRGRDVDEPLDRSLERRAEDGVVEAVVHLEQRVRAACGSWRSRRRSPPGGSRACSRRAAARASASIAQVAGVDLAGLAHPAGRLALVGHAHLAVGVAHQPAHHGGADRAGAAGDEHAAHSALDRARSRTSANTRPGAGHVPRDRRAARPRAAARAGPRTRSGWWPPPRRRRPRARPRAARTRRARAGRGGRRGPARARAGGPA